MRTVGTDRVVDDVPGGPGHQHAPDQRTVFHAQRVGCLDQVAPRVAHRHRDHQHQLEEAADEDDAELLRLAELVAPAVLQTSEKAVRGEWSLDPETVGAEPRQDWNDDPFLFLPDVSTFSRVGVQPAYSQPRLIDAKIAPQRLP